MRRLAVTLLVLGVLAAACSSGSIGEASRPAGGEEPLGAPTASTVAAEEAVDEGRRTAAAQATTTVPGQVEEPLPLPPGLRVIREARLELQVEEGTFQERWNRVRDVTLDLGGYLSDASVDVEERDGERYAFGTATLRIPSERFDAALDRLAGLGERIGLDISSQDVSEEYVDLEARLRHWKAVEAFHLDLLERAETVDEALKVQQQLQHVQLTIEQIEGRLRYLDSRTTFSTVTVFMTEAPLPMVAEREGPPDELAEALAQARQVLMVVFGFLIVAAAAVFPLALVGGTTYLLWRLGRRLAPHRGGA